VSGARARNPHRALPFPVEFDTFRAAVGLAIIAGALGLVAPYLDSLAAALAALAAAGWAAAHARQRSAGASGVGPARSAGLASVALGAAAFFLLPGPLALGRGLLLGLAWLPMWWIERRSRTGAIGSGDGAR
jgi:hypothetical protein